MGGVVGAARTQLIVCVRIRGQEKVRPSADMGQLYARPKALPDRDIPAFTFKHRVTIFQSAVILSNKKDILVKKATKDCLQGA